MSVAGLLRQLKDLGVEMTLDGGRLRVVAPKGTLTPELTEHMRKEKESLIALLSQSKTAQAGAFEPIVASPPDQPAPLSHAQNRLWFLDRLNGDSAALNLPFTVRMRGALDVSALRFAVQELGRRHDALRSVVVLVDGNPHQVVEPQDLEITIVDLRELPQHERERALFTRRAREMARPLPSDVGPLIRFFLFRLADDDQLFMFVASHMIFDGWSHDLVLREVQDLYEVPTLGREAPPAPEVRFADYVRWHRSWLEQPEQRRGLEHFQNVLAGMPFNLDFPCDKKRPQQMSYPAVNSLFRLDGEVLTKLRRIASAAGATFNMLALASVEALVARYSGQEDFGVGVPVLGRQRQEVQQLIGMFVNTLVFRSDVPGGGRFRDLLERVRDRAIASLSHEDTPFEELVHMLRPPRDRSRTPLYQVMFSYHEVSARRYRMADIEIEQLPSFSGTIGTDMTFWIRDHGDYAVAAFQATTVLFEPETIARIAHGWRRMLEAIAENPDALLEALPIMALEDERRLVDDLNQTRLPYRDELCVHELFEAEVDRHPDRTALLFEETRLSFAELDAEANAIANMLRRRGVGADDLVGVCLERGPRLVASLLGILKSGGAYVPLDPHYPPERIRHVVSDSHAKVVITTRDLGRKLGLGVELLVLDGLASDVRAENSRPNAVGGPADLAYVIYTSGSTGKPKGVMLEHRNVISFFAGMRDAIGLDDHGTWLAATSVSFDISVLEILGSLTHGRTVALLGDTVLGEVRDLRYTLAALALRHQVTHFQCTPSQARMLLLSEAGRNALRGLEQMIVGGEPLPEDLAAELKRLVRGDLVNAYGPTETTVWSSTARVLADAPITIGRPIANTCFFVLDKGGWLTPRGAIGELYIGGPGVARGYLGQPELTAERFVPNRIRPELSQRLYRTGDLVRYRNDGALEYIGRNDDQVKIRGHRIEVGEIESVLRSLPGVRAAAVLAMQDASGGRLVAFLVPEPGYAGEDGARKALKSQLPEYMVPAAFVRLEALPLTPNGKVDRKALPSIESRPDAVREFVRAPDELTQRLSVIWQRAIGIARIGITDDFFELGGHSMVAVKIFNAIHRELGVQLPLSALFENPTVEQLAARIRESQAAPAAAAERWSPLVAIQVGGRLPPFFCAAGLGGNPMNLRHIAAALGPDQPFYGLQYRGVDGRLPPHETMASMADELLQRIREVQPSGPYFLGGYSAGGVPAFEIACRLLEQGETLGLLVLFDTFNPTLPNFTLVERIGAHVKNLHDVGFSYFRDRLKAGVERRLHSVQRAIRAKLGSNYDFEYRHDAVEVAFLKGLRSYAPPELQGDMLLVQANFQFDAGDGIGFRLDESNGWRQHVKGRFDIVKIDCEHLDVVAPNIAPIAGEIVREGLTSARERLGIDLPPLSVRPSPANRESSPPSRDTQRPSASMGLK